MTDPNVHIVTKTEVHYLSLCECNACANERRRREFIPLPDRGPIRRVTAEAAYLFGYIKALNPFGSVAREIANK